MASKMMFTGGGTAGHVTVNLALIPRLQQEGWTCEYIGSYDGIEKQLISQLKDVPYYGISTGKLRRYLDVKNMKDPFRVMKGVMQAYRIIRKSKPDIVFSKGGFVSVPVILGAWLNRVPAVIHESDLTPGLANKIAMPFAKKLCVTFPETMNHVPKDKAVLVGGVIREELRSGSKLRGYQMCGFTTGKPVVLIMGGSQGSKVINDKIRSVLGRLTERFQVVHICGKNQVDPTINNRYYKQFEYVHEELADLMAMTDIVISRAGSNSIFEFLALRKPMLLIPLSRNASRGDQILNAASFVKSGYAESIQEEELTGEGLLEALNRLFDQREQYVQQMNRAQDSSLDNLIHIIKQTMKL